MTTNNLTIVTGLWDINRINRHFDTYLDHFKKLLEIDQNLFIYIPKKYENLIWQYRTKHNTYIKNYELSDIQQMYSPFFDKTQKIRTSIDWLNQAAWLRLSPQACNEMYNPIVQSKMFWLHDTSIWDPFKTDYFFWLDAGILNTVPYDHIISKNLLSKLPQYSNPFLFLSYPYEPINEIHGFALAGMRKYINEPIKYVCRGGLFGGHKLQIGATNAEYYALLDTTLNHGYMGTEESIFTIMSYSNPQIYQRYELDDNGLIVKFTNAIMSNSVEKNLVYKHSQHNTCKKYTNNDIKKLKTYLYILTFNFNEQLKTCIEYLRKNEEWINNTTIFVLDNSTNIDSQLNNKILCQKYDTHYIHLGNNIGICGGRQFAAEHFDNSNADFMLFFEDDMLLNDSTYMNQFCRNGFQKFVPELYYKIHKIMLKDKFDFLKLSFTEVYFDNDKQCAWYNVPQDLRTKYWPEYDKLPIKGLDPNVPLTKFKNIRTMDGLSYIDGEIYYANWPMIVSKSGNKKMFINTKWEHPFEQTWMSHMYNMTKQEILKPALLLASPITHNRIKFYNPNERKEN